MQKVASMRSVRLFVRASRGVLLVMFPLLVVLVKTVKCFVVGQTLGRISLVYSRIRGVDGKGSLSGQLSLPGTGSRLCRLSRGFGRVFRHLRFSFRGRHRFASSMSRRLQAPVTIIVSRYRCLLRGRGLSTRSGRRVTIVLERTGQVSGLADRVLVVTEGRRSRRRLVRGLSFKLLDRLMVRRLRAGTRRGGVRVALRGRSGLFVGNSRALLLHVVVGLVAGTVGCKGAGKRVRIVLGIRGSRVINRIGSSNVKVDRRRLSGV